MTKIKLTTYVKDIVKEYGIPDTRTRNIRTMFVKHLQKANLWDDADQANDITKTKIFDTKDLETIKQRLHTYLQENNKEAIEKTKIRREQIAQKKETERLRKNMVEDVMSYRDRMREERCKITGEMKRDIMLEALYNMYFEDVDVEQWYSDRVTMDKFYMDNLRAEHKGQPRRDKNRPERAASKRLENRAQSYCKKKAKLL